VAPLVGQMCGVGTSAQCQRHLKGGTGPCGESLNLKNSVFYSPGSINAKGPNWPTLLFSFDLLARTLAKRLSLADALGTRSSLQPQQLLKIRPLSVSPNPKIAAHRFLRI